MTLDAATYWAPSACRAAAVAAAATLFARGLAAVLPACAQRRRRLAWCLLLAPALTPPILTGYACSDLALVALERPLVREAAYALLLIARFTPFAVLVLHLTWAGVAPEARHCNRLLAPGTTPWRHALRGVRLWLRGSSTTLAVAFTLVFLLSFLEFDLASFFLVNQWTVTVFDRQAGGTPVSESLQLAAAPLVAGTIVLALGCACLPRLQRRQLHTGTLSPAARVAFWIYAVAATLVVTVLPAVSTLRSASNGLPSLLGGFSLHREVVASLLVAGAATFLAWQLTTLVASRMDGSARRPRRLALAMCLALPGLLGPLVISLVLLRFFQLPALHALYDTPVPLLLALTLALLPVAFLLRLALDHGHASSAYHAARLLHAAGDGRRRTARALCWRLGARRGYWLAAMLFCWAYFDVIASAMLAPAAMPPLMPRLYNFMHYGRSAALSAMLVVAVAVPVLAMSVLHPLWRRWVPIHE